MESIKIQSYKFKMDEFGIDSPNDLNEKDFIEYAKKKIHNEKMKIYNKERKEKLGSVIVCCEFCNKEHKKLDIHMCKGKLLNKWCGISDRDIELYLEKRKQHKKDYNKNYTNKNKDVEYNREYMRNYMRELRSREENQVCVECTHCNTFIKKNNWNIHCKTKKHIKNTS